MCAVKGRWFSDDSLSVSNDTMMAAVNTTQPGGIGHLHDCGGGGGISSHNFHSEQFLPRWRV